MKKTWLTFLFFLFSTSVIAQSGGNASHRFFVLNVSSMSKIQSSSDLSIKKGNICGRVKDDSYFDGFSDQSWVDVPVEISDQTQLRNLHTYLDSPADFEFAVASLCEFLVASADDTELLALIEKTGMSYREVPR